MAELLFGVETEYAIAGVSPGGDGPRGNSAKPMERARAQLIHLPDLHPAGGVFLQNGFTILCRLRPSSGDLHARVANPWMLFATSWQDTGFLADSPRR